MGSGDRAPSGRFVLRADVGRGRGRPRVLTEDAIARAVLDVGFPNLTFRAVSRRLGVGQTTLFRYVRDRAELARLGLDLLIDEAEWPPLEGPWRSVLEAYALAAWHLWESAPGSATEAVRGPMPHATLRMMRNLCALLMAQGFTARNAVRTCDLVFDLVGDSRRDIENSRRPASADAHPAAAPGVGSGAEAVEGRRDVRTLLVTDCDQDIAVALAEALAADPLEWFSSKLAVVLDGVEASLAPTS